MPRQYRLDDLRTRCQRRANMETDPSIGNPEWNALISEQYGELYSIVEESGMRWVESTQAITATGAASYTLATDHLATITLRRIDANGGKTDLDEVMTQEEARYAGQTGDATSFAIVGQSIFLYPRPSSGSYELLYLPQAPDLSVAADSTLVDLVQASGESFLINGVAVKAMTKGERDWRGCAAEREAARVRFEWWCTQRAFLQPRRPIVRRSINQLMSNGDFVDDPGGWWDVRPT